MTDESASIAAPVLRDARTRRDLEDWGPLEEATGPEMRTAGLYLWQGGDGAESGIWECTPGPSRWTLETNEFVHVLTGSMTVTADGGAPVHIGPGDTALFPRGWTGTWEIHETLRKLYVIF
ncbi:MAG: cupin domain-containing protein [Actinomycetota bacterium]|jgi:uncharacterized cupin superfamily protein|nr:cupin domain-containing protein [Actinomycetota bacterium]